MAIIYRQVSAPFNGCQRGCSPQHFAHISVLVQGVNWLSSKPNWSSGRASTQDSNHVGTTDKPTSTDGSPLDKPCSTSPTMNATFHFLYLSMHMPNGKPELGVTPRLGSSLVNTLLESDRLPCVFSLPSAFF